MYDDAIDPYDMGMREISRRLEAFADTRLDPSLSGTSRMRTTVMNAAHRRAALIAADRTFDAVAATAATTTTVPARAAERSRVAMRAWRRPMAALAAGALMLALVGGTASAARAGGPLYAARIWIEMANLPAGALARAEAEVTRLDARLQEAKQAYVRRRRACRRGRPDGLFGHPDRGGRGKRRRPGRQRGDRSQPHPPRRGPRAHGRQRASHEPGSGPARAGRRARWSSRTSMTRSCRTATSSQGRPADDILGPTGPTRDQAGASDQGSRRRSRRVTRGHAQAREDRALPTRMAAETATVGRLRVMPIPRPRVTPTRPHARPTSRQLPSPGGPDRPDAP